MNEIHSSLLVSSSGVVVSSKLSKVRWLSFDSPWITCYLCSLGTVTRSSICHLQLRMARWHRVVRFKWDSPGRVQQRRSWWWSVKKRSVSNIRQSEQNLTMLEQHRGVIQPTSFEGREGLWLSAEPRRVEEFGGWRSWRGIFQQRYLVMQNCVLMEAHQMFIEPWSMQNT